MQRLSVDLLNLLEDVLSASVNKLVDLAVDLGLGIQVDARRIDEVVNMLGEAYKIVWKLKSQGDSDKPIFYSAAKEFMDKFIDRVSVSFPRRFIRGFSIIENSVKQIRLYFTDLSFYDLSVLERMAIEYFSGVYTHVNLSTTGGNNRLEVIITLRRVEQ